MSPLTPYLSEDDQSRFHLAGLRLLAETGLSIEDRPVVERLLDAGCRQEKGRVLVPPDVVEGALNRAPDAFTLYDRFGEPAYHIGDGQTRCQPVGGTPFVIDMGTSARRPATLRDLEDLARLMDSLDNLHVLTTATSPTDVDDDLQSLIAFAAVLTFSAKPVSAPGVNNPAEARLFARLAEAASGASTAEKPCFIASLLPVSPLRFPRGLAEGIAETARLGAPISIVPLPVMGVSAPLDYPGALAQQHAENLAVTVIAQLYRPGLPVAYHGRLSLGNMRTGASIWGRFDIGLAGAWAAALGKRCGLPTNVYGFATSSKSTDLQSGAERAFGALLPYLAGADILGGAGSLADIMAVSPAQLVIDNEIMAWLQQLTLASEQLAETPSLEVIDDVARSPQATFMYDKHTVRTLRQRRQWLGEVCDRSTFTDFEAAGSRTMADLARSRLDEILKQASREPRISPKNRQELDQVLRTAKAELGKTGA